MEFHQAFRAMDKLSTIQKKSKIKRIRFRIKQRGVRVGFESRSNTNKLILIKAPRNESGLKQFSILTSHVGIELGLKDKHEGQVGDAAENQRWTNK